MFGIGMPEMIVILAVALIVIGPKKLPDLAKSLGRALNEFKKTASDFKETVELDDELKDVKQTFTDVKGSVKKSIDLKIENKKSVVSAHNKTPKNIEMKKIGTEGKQKNE